MTMISGMKPLKRLNIKPGNSFNKSMKNSKAMGSATKLTSHKRGRM